MKNECSNYEILISAALDGELDPAEFARLESHVETCADCRRQYRNFEAVNDLVLTSDEQWSTASPGRESLARERVETSGRIAIESAISRNGQSHSPNLPFAGEKPTPRREKGNFDRGRTFLAGGFLAATAAGLAALLTSGTDEATTSPLSSSEFRSSVEKVSNMNRTAHTLQQTQTRMMNQELRTMRLMARHSGGDQTEVAQLEKKIDDLMQRLQDLESQDLIP